MGREIDNYFKIFTGKEALYSTLPKYVKPAVEVLILDGKFVAQKRLWDNDEMLSCNEIVEPPDLGEYDSMGNRT